jgi:hypothetical protein
MSISCLQLSDLYPHGLVLSHEGQVLSLAGPRRNILIDSAVKVICVWFELCWSFLLGGPVMSKVRLRSSSNFALLFKIGGSILSFAFIHG